MATSGINQAEIKETDKELTVTLSGDMGIARSEDLKQLLSGIILEKRDIKVIIDNPDAIDLSTVQLFYAFKKQREENELTTEFSADITESKATLLNDSKVNIFS